MTATTTATANLIAHLPCHACQYDLHMLASDGSCPECGEQVAESIRRDSERDEDGRRQSAIGGVAGSFCLFVVGNFIAIYSDPPLVIEFACIWAVVGLLSLIGSVVLEWKRQHAIAVAVGIVMVLAIPAVLINLYLCVVLGSMGC